MAVVVLFHRRDASSSRRSAPTVRGSPSCRRTSGWPTSPRPGTTRASPGHVPSRRSSPSARRRRSGGPRDARRVRVRRARASWAEGALPGRPARHDDLDRGDHRPAVLPVPDDRPDQLAPRASSSSTSAWACRSASSGCVRRSGRSPRSLLESAEIDGAGPLRMLRSILRPDGSRPAIYTLILLSFMWTWNDYFLSLVFLHRTNQTGDRGPRRRSRVSSSRRSTSWRPAA